MKLKNYILIGYVASAITTILAVLWAVNLMLIEKKDIYFIILITIIGSILGAGISRIMLRRVFNSLEVLRKQTENISERNFEQNIEIKNPKEFSELSSSFNMMAKKLKSTFESLEESEKEKSLMIAQLTHDIKTPITSIQATIEGMVDGVIKEEEYPHYWMTINRQTTRLNKLVEELNYLILSSGENKLVEENEVIFLDKLLIDCMSEFGVRAEKEKRDIYIKVNPEAAKIENNYDKLLRIIVNLINNAFKYSEKGTKIEISAEKIKNKLYISVTDEGCGIAKDELENIFKRLYRVEESRNLQTGGYGLGLAISKQLAKQLGGDITVVSEYGRGSTFTLEIPA